MPDLTREQLFEIYRYLRLNRGAEDRLVNLYRQGKVLGGLHRSLGQEATSVGSAYALEKGDVVGGLIRRRLCASRPLADSRPRPRRTPGRARGWTAMTSGHSTKQRVAPRNAPARAKAPHSPRR